MGVIDRAMDLFCFDYIDWGNSGDLKGLYDMSCEWGNRGFFGAVWMYLLYKTQQNQGFRSVLNTPY